jgi:TolB-like protein/DNA-binding winged helix-turn-helix (wHTH) protein/Flp pilus assembly protein TadD
MSQRNPISDPLIRFGIFELDLRAGELRRNGARVKLQEQPLQILEALLENPGRVVTREDLRKRIWPADTFVDFDRGLYSALARLREALSDSAESPRYIETVPRRGYRFIAPVEAVTASPVEDASAAGVPRSAARRYVVPALASLAFGTCLILALLLSGRIPWNWRWKHAAAPIRSLAVLPLENLSGDTAQEYFADGMTDELITALAQLGNVQVISRSSVMRFKGTKTPLPQIAQELHVDAIVEGSVMRSGQHVRITAQLLDASADRHLWAHSYERDLRDVVVLQAEVASAIVREINGTLTPGQRARMDNPRAANPEAYVAYLKGRYFLNNQRSTEGARKSLEHSLQAVQIDPDWPLAYAGLADSYVSAGFLAAFPARDVLPKAKLAAEKALQLDANLSEAHVALGMVLANLDFDYTTAEREFKRAVELSPSSSYAHQSYSDYLANVGRVNEAISEIKLAQELDPMSFWVSRDVGRIFYEARRYDEALAALREASEMNPNSPVVYNWLSWTYDKKGMIQESVQMDLRDEASHGASEATLWKLRRTFEKSGQPGYLKQKLKTTRDDAYIAGQINARLGNRDEALRWLEKAYEQRSGYVALLKVDPELDDLHSDSRFQTLLRRMNLLQ